MSAQDNPLTPKERLQAAKDTANHINGSGSIVKCWRFVQCPIESLSGYKWCHGHGEIASMLLDGLSVHEVTMAEVELDEDATPDSRP